MKNKLLFLLTGMIILIGSLGLISASFETSLDNGLVAYYSFDVDMNLTDSLYAKNLTNNGATFNNAGKLGKSIYLTGSGKTVYTPALGDLSTQTFCMWFKEAGAGRQFFFGRSSPDVNFYGDIAANNSMEGGGGSAKAWGPTTYEATRDNSWQFFCLMGSPTNFTMYQNGTWKSVDTNADAKLVENTNPVYHFGAYQGYTTDSWAGYIDEVGIWNRSLSDSEINTLWNSGNGLTYITTIATPDISVNLTLPLNNSIILTQDYNFISNLSMTGVNLSYSWVNNTFDIWYSNGTLFNSSLVTGLSTNSTNATKNISGLNLGNYKWNSYACYGNTTFSNCTWSSNGNFSFSVGISVSSVSYNATTIPTASETFLLQGIKTTMTSSINATLNYNGTNYPSIVVISGNNVNISNSLSIPSSALGNTTFYWVISSFGTSGSITQNSSTYGQDVGNLSIYSCTSPPSSGLALNFTLYDESDKTKLNGSLEATFNYFALGGTGSTSKTFNFASIKLSKSNWMFCINSSNLNTSFSGYASYYADYYDRREYIFANATVGNFTQNIPLYLSLIADTEVVTVIVTDQNYNPLPNSLVNIQEWNVGTDTYSTIGMFYVDSSGNGIINLELYNLWYRAIVTIGGQIVKVTDVKKLSSTTWAIVVDVISDDSYTLFNSISHGLVFDNLTNITTFSWVDSSGYVNYGCLDIRNKTNLGYKSINLECVSSVAGTINYQLVGNGNYEIVGTIYLLPIYNVSKITDSKYVRLGTPTDTTLISRFGKVLSFIFIGVFAFLGVSAGSPIWGVILLMISIFISGKLGWLNITESILWGLLSIAVVIIFRQTRRGA